MDSESARSPRAGEHQEPRTGRRNANVRANEATHSRSQPHDETRGGPPDDEPLSQRRVDAFQTRLPSGDEQHAAGDRRREAGGTPHARRRTPGEAVVNRPNATDPAVERSTPPSSRGPVLVRPRSPAHGDLAVARATFGFHATALDEPTAPLDASAVRAPPLDTVRCPERPSPGLTPHRRSLG